MIDDIECKRIRAIYSKKKHAAKKHHSDQGFFGEFSADDFVRWWGGQLGKQDGQCAYCQTPIKLIKRLVEADLLRTRKTRGDGKRGACLELERKDPSRHYEADNCVLVCMYCNNDKSNIYGHDEYKRFFGPNRRAHYEWIAKGLPESL